MRDVHWCVTVFYQQIENSNIANQIHGFTTDYGKFILKCGRRRVVPLLLSPSCVTRKKPARKKMAARDPGGEKHLAPRISRGQVFFAVFLNRVTHDGLSKRRTTRRLIMRPSLRSRGTTPKQNALFPDESLLYPSKNIFPNFVPSG